MDLVEECSKSNLEEGEDEKNIEAVKKMEPFEVNREKINGEMGFEENSELNIPVQTVEESIEPIGSPSLAPKVNGGGIVDKNKEESSPRSIESSSNSNLEVNSEPRKGYGLKKWRRIRRDYNKDAGGAADSSVILKRRLSANESSKAQDDNKAKIPVEEGLETPTPSVGSLRSTEAVDAVGLDPELIQLMTAGAFAIGMDSDNSEDRSSKSSTAASFPKPRHEIGFGRERGRMKSIGGRVAGNALQQRNQRGKAGVVDASKKIRGDRISLEKENSQSSVESDLRSSNMGFMLWGSGVSNGKQSEKSLNFDGENGDETQTSEEVRSGYYKENGIVEDLLKGDLDPNLLEESKVNRQNFHPPSGIDPFVESFVMLQAAQEALELEIKKIGEIGNATECNDFDDQSEETEASSSPTFEAHLLELNHKIENLQYKLDEASAVVKAKELKIIDLEDIINQTHLPSKESSSTTVPTFEEMNDLEFELEDLFKKKIQSEIELLIITRTTQSWKILAEDQIALLEEQKSLAVDQAHALLRLNDAEEKAIKLKDQAEELDSHCKELLGTEKVLKLQNKVCKYSFCCFIQLVLLFVALGLFMIQMIPPSDDFVPT
ncbi:uncharacterized protein A4U43_C05F21280 [Asparagus officinalis]|uniref:WPP domain-containing protein n=1 Tax=Asparagus officinalis TaxID=4686 RepID=A0A5P1ETB4_ASPOF|nr:WPP domain-interacting protein 2 [Asparagus officinalis]XP_020264268.1 WPP domain-interacting protein 2 [Asparagus officinalis]ONK69288.1 uncharacterized protein A4U43_C05F21280 [Asparagus officinalis]